MGSSPSLTIPLYGCWKISISLPESPDVASGPTQHAPLGALFGTRSGDKGPNANLGVFARTPEAFAWLSGYLTVDKLKELMPEAEERKIDRYDLPNLLKSQFYLSRPIGGGRGGFGEKKTLKRRPWASTCEPRS